MNASEIAKELAKLRAELKETENQKTKETQELNQMYKVIRDLESKLHEARDIRNEKQASHKTTLERDQRLKYLIQEQERALRRAQEQELAAQRLLKFANDMAERTMLSPWRKENREDGQGALPHQIDGAIVLASAALGSEKPSTGSFNFDQRGLGKTLTSNIWADYIAAEKIIYLTINDTLRNVEREVRLWSPHRKVFRLGGRDKISRDMVFDMMRSLGDWVLVVNYEAWRKDWSVIEDLISLQADTIILDEAHHLNKTSTHTFRGVEALMFAANQCPKCGDLPHWSCSCAMINSGTKVRCQRDSCDRKYEYTREAMCAKCGHLDEARSFISIKGSCFMSGTPVLNKPQELYPLLHLGDPEGFSGEYNFLQDFCRQVEVYDKDSKKWRKTWVWQGNYSQDSLLKRISHRVILRNRKDAGVVIPPQKVIEHILPFDQETYRKQAKVLRDINEFAAIQLSENVAVSLPHIFSVITRKRQAIVWPAGIKLPIFEVDNEGNLVKVGERQLDVFESQKLDKAEELIREFIEEGSRIVLFSQFKAPLHELQRRIGDRAVVYDGTTTERVKDEVELEFDARTAPAQDETKYDVVLCNYRAAGEGLNFNAADTMVILDEEWNPGKRDQSYGRIDRMGQTKETQVHVIRVEKSIDDWMRNLIDTKEKMIGQFETATKLAQTLRDAILGGDIL
jgi:SNF2 family DNA or RNA helicase